MVLTNFECWAHSDSNIDNAFSSGGNMIDRRYSSVDLFNPSAVQLQFCNENTRNTEQPMNNNNNNVNNKNVSHLSSNGYYGFAQICNVDTSNGPLSSLPFVSATQKTQENMENHYVSFPHDGATTINVNATNDLTSVPLRNENQQMMDVEQQFSIFNDGHSVSPIGVNLTSIGNSMSHKNRYSERRKRFFTEENDLLDAIDRNTKRFRSCSQQHLETQGDFSSTFYATSNASITTTHPTNTSNMDHDDTDDFHNGVFSNALPSFDAINEYGRSVLPSTELSTKLQSSTVADNDMIATATDSLSCASFKRGLLKCKFSESNVTASDSDTLINTIENHNESHLLQLTLKQEQFLSKLTINNVPTIHKNQFHPLRQSTVAANKNTSNFFWQHTSAKKHLENLTNLPNIINNRQYHTTDLFKNLATKKCNIHSVNNNNNNNNENISVDNKFKIMTDFLNKPTNDDEIENSDYRYSRNDAQENDNQSDEKLLWSIHGVSDHLIWRQDEI